MHENGLTDLLPEQEARPMRVLHVLHHSIPVVSGYTVRTMQMLRAQRALGWETCQVTGPRHAPYCDPVETVDGWRFLRTRRAPVQAGIFRGMNELIEMKYLRDRIAATADEFRPDVIHAHSPVLNALPALAVAQRKSIPLVYEIRSSWEDAAVSRGDISVANPRYWASRFLETLVCKRADAVATICEGLRDSLVARGISIDRIAIVPNAIHPRDIAAAGRADQQLARELGLNGKDVIGYIGTLESFEDLHTLLRAVPGLVRARPNIRVLVVGTGPREASLREEARRLGIRDYVVFTGLAPHGSIQSYYDLVDICVYPRGASRLTELTTPLKPLEAMAKGKIVVATDIGGHRELIEDGVTGHLFPPGDIQVLVETICRLFDRRSHWHAERAASRAFLVRQRNWQHNAQRYRMMYDQVRRAADDLPTQPGPAVEPDHRLMAGHRIPDGPN